MVRAGLLVVGLALTQIASAAEVNFAGLVQRLPAAMPADAITAQKSQGASLAAMATLNQDLQNATIQVNNEQANRLYAGTGMAPGNDDPATQQKRMQEMATQMQGMSQQQQIAMAMKMQQQVQSNMGMQAAILTPGEQQAMTTLAQDPRRSNELMMSGNAMTQKVMALRQAADAEHQQVDVQLQAALKTAYAVTTHSDADCVALARKAKQLQVDAGNRNIAISNKLLGQLQPVYAEYRKRSGDELQHMNQDVSVAATIHNGAMQKQAAQSVSTARMATLASTQAAVEFYKQGFDESRWAERLDQANAITIGKGCDGGG
jgi:hypothetical protein